MISCSLKTCSETDSLLYMFLGPFLIFELFKLLFYGMERLKADELKPQSMSSSEDVFLLAPKLISLFMTGCPKFLIAIFLKLL